MYFFIIQFFNLKIIIINNKNSKTKQQQQEQFLNLIPGV